jgi:hypothetical protein
MKLTLNLEELSVDSFATDTAAVVTAFDSIGPSCLSCESVCCPVDTRRCPP